jgi:Tfp pilus assembly protein PilV
MEKMKLLLYKKMAWSINTSKGFSLVEALLSVALLLLFSVGGIAANKLATTSVVINQARSRANILASEGMEALMSVRADNFAGLTTGDFHPLFTEGHWTLVSGSETLGGFTRTISLSPVLREVICVNLICDIVAEGGVSDEGSFMATVKVSWLQAGEARDTSLSSLITYWR